MRAATFALLIASTLAVPAMAGPRTADEREAARIARTLEDPRTQDALAGAMVALTDSLLDVRIDRLRAAMARIDPEAGYRDDDARTLGDIVRRDDPDFERNLYRDTRRATAAMGAAASGLADLLPEFRRMAEDFSRKVERETRRIERR